MHKIGLTVLFLTSILCTAFGLRCYQCESLTNPKCGEDFQPEDAMKYECDRVVPPRFFQNIMPTRNATGCMKKILDSVAGHAQIVRTCYFGDVGNTRVGCQPDPSLPFLKDISCDVCSTDLCNASSLFGPLSFVILSAVTILSLIL